MTVYSLGAISPSLPAPGEYWIAPTASVMGNVILKKNASIWWGAIARGDNDPIEIGENSNVQDGSVIHCDSPDSRHPAGFPTILGEDVLVGHMAMVHGCIVEDRGFVGLGAIVMSGAHIESDGMLAAGAMLTGGKRIGARQLWGGRPAAFMRDLTDAALADMQR
ncbi:MAG: hypothetical protein B7Y78_14545, partial [Caulobacter sp. 35-67-4]